ncbi:SUMF1/EgtB/PvdO family nonheme iron enzyme [Arthrobacter sp. LAPM80]|uniref:SUMF1/EgtB/PvdO family nonheme iron enzyme n=1 Tax=Arthrobacter sp. LAPM80 TaxID=3141788 RepID=UPI00398BAA86
MRGAPQWTAADAVEGPHPVAGKEPNGYGLFDVICNVWEGCWDYADTARYAASAPPTPCWRMWVSRRPGEPSGPAASLPAVGAIGDQSTTP